MSYTAVFRRYEIKYLLSEAQYAALLPAIQAHMEPDRHGLTTIQNLYFDTEQYRLIRRSIEKPVYKEKLRLRSYGSAKANEEVFVELKKKYDSVVYKRRIAMKGRDAMAWLCNKSDPVTESQITREISYFLEYYGPLFPKLFLSYDRQAYSCADGSDLRITFDTNILCRDHDLHMDRRPGDIPILEQGKILMEVKTAGAIPLWMVQQLNRLCIRKCAFSKYGTAYETILYPKWKGVLFHA
ncbi:MAG: polyphosphate polymerase domain-containing protein [Oscillospiraceae bacterium]|nr:polyphosphate polymerase domain-containing protein [Oscillospiraceae bacterium]